MKHDQNFICFGDSVKGCVGFVDIADSTTITSNLPDERIAEFFSSCMNPLIETTQRNRGIVFKIVGDGFFFFFEEPKIKIEPKIFHQIIHCGLALIDEIEKINQILNSKKFPTVKIRISLEYGVFQKAKCKSSSVEDLYGHSMAACTKINCAAYPNELVFGSSFYQNMSPRYDYEVLELPPCVVGKGSFQVYTLQNKQRCLV